MFLTDKVKKNTRTAPAERRKISTRIVKDIKKVRRTHGTYALSCAARAIFQPVGLLLVIQFHNGTLQSAALGDGANPKDAVT